MTGVNCVGVTAEGEGMEGLASLEALERMVSGGIGIFFSTGGVEGDESDSFPGPAMGGAREVAGVSTLFGGHSRRSFISSRAESSVR